jgi:hypothetical protein
VSEWPRTARRTVAALVAALVLVVVAAVVLVVRDGGSSADAATGTTSVAAAEFAAGQDATAAASSLLVRMTTYDWHHVDHDFAWLADGTAAFRADLPNEKQVTAIIRRVRATATGKVVAAAPQVTDADHVTVLAFVDQTIRSARQPGARSEQTRVSLGMVRQDGAWVADAVDIQSLLG